jgi:rare lipoprotein A
VSVRAAKLLGFYGQGTAPVKVEYVAPAPLRGSDDQILAATLRQDGPAPPPSTVRLASRVFPPAPPSTSATAAVLASAAGGYPLRRPLGRTVSYADQPEAAYGTAPPEADYSAEGSDTAQFLSGRGLY